MKAQRSRIVVSPPAEPVEPEPAEVSPGWPDWRQTLRFEDAPTILEAEEASLLARLGTSAHPIYEILKRQEIQAAHGNPPANRLRWVPAGKKKLIPKACLLEYLMGEAQ